MCQSLTIASGLAEGIDTLSHETTLANSQNTIAVVATGLDITYPYKNNKLAKKIEENGLILSEYPLGTPPIHFHFPQRNRLVCGISKGILVCEAAKKSGSLITANLATDQNKTVYTVPGPIFSKTFHGNHALIQDGACLVESAKDILTDFQSNQFLPNTEIEPAKKPQFNEEEALVYNCLDFVPQTLELLIEKSNISSIKVLQILSKFELQGIVTQCPGKQFIKSAL